MNTILTIEDGHLWMRPMNATEAITYTLSLGGELTEAQQPDGLVRVEFSKMYLTTIQKHSSLTDKLALFIETKKSNPMQRFSGSDKKFVKSTPLGKLDINHAHLNHDVSVLYKIHGSPPTLYIYGLFSHDESGTDASKSSTNAQRSLTSRIKNEF